MYVITASNDNIVTVHETFKNGLDASIMVNALITSNTTDRIEASKDEKLIQEYVRNAEGIWFTRGGTINEWSRITFDM